MYKSRPYVQRQNVRQPLSQTTHIDPNAASDGRAARNAAPTAAQRSSRRLARMGHRQLVHETRDYPPPRISSPAVSKGERIMVPVAWLVVLTVCGAWIALLAAATARVL